MQKPANYPVNRRALLASTALGAMLGKPTFAQTPVAEDGQNPYFLITGASTSDTRGWFDDLEVFDSNLTSLGGQQFQEAALRVDSTGNPTLIQVHTLSGMFLLDLENIAKLSVDWGIPDPGLLHPMRYNSNGIDRNPDWMLFSNTELTRALLLNLQTFEGRDIADHIAPPWATTVPVLPNIPEEGSLATVWTGDFVYLVDFEDPENAVRLIGDEADWYSTAANINNDQSIVAFTAYDPDSDGETAQVHFMDIATQEFSVIAEGTAWSGVYFIPNDPDHFLLTNPGQVELRTVAAPEEEGEVIAKGGSEGFELYWLNDKNLILHGYKEASESAQQWQLIDLVENTTTPLPDLEGQTVMWPDLAKSDPKWLMFGPDTVESGAGMLHGLDIATAEVWTVMEDVYLHSDSPVSASHDGKFYCLATKNRGTNKGAWLFDLENRDTHSFPYGDGKFTERASVSPDGATVAIGIVEQPGSYYLSYTAPTTDPDNLTELTERVILRWI